MPRTYKKLVGPRSRPKYTEDQIAKVVAAVKKGLSIRKAGELHGVPYTTLRDKVQSRHQSRYGSQQVLNPEEEANLMKGLLISAQ